MTAYQQLTDQILDLLAQGVVPWQQPFSSRKAPVSAQTGKAYRGINQILLSIAANNCGFSSRYWLTFKQAKERGGSVRKGEKGSRIFFYSPIFICNGKTVKDARKAQEMLNAGQPVERKFLFKSFVVFNRDQVDGLAEDGFQDENGDERRDQAESIAAAEEIVAGYENGPRIRRESGGAYYSPATDIVTIPAAEEFVSDELHYCVLFHELAHSTGHKSRLGRLPAEGKIAAFGSQDYGKEELVAELAAAFLCGEAEISPATIENSAAYLDNWRRAISGDVQLVAKASAAAAKAADHILGRS